MGEVRTGLNLSREKLNDIYRLMHNRFGPRGWWPAETPFEVCVGAILTQSVSWKNVEKAISNLSESGLMDVNSLFRCSLEDIEKCIVPTMYYRMKARKLKAFVDHLVIKYDGSLQTMFSQDLNTLRDELLGIYGIGPETADSIILYAAGKPVFVVDAYTRRIFSRLGVFREDVSYNGMQDCFMELLPPDVQYYNEYHALITGVGNRYCGNKRPKCIECPLNPLCSYCR